MSYPLVSVCIPTFNGAGFIGQCIESCANQTYPNIEIVICDDCSSDETISIIEKYAKADKRIKVYKNANNLGLVGNWNATLKNAAGEYIKWMFQDDLMEHNAVESFVEAAKSNHDFIVSKRNFVLYPEATESEKDYYFKKIRKLENYFSDNENTHYFNSAEIARLTTENIALNFIGEPSLIFFKRSLINEVGLYDDKLVQICDLEFNLRLAVKSGVFVINKPLCSFSIHANSTTSSNLNKKYFRLRYIEQAYFAFKLLNDKAFFLLQNQLSFMQKLKLGFYWKYRMHEANKYIARQTNKTECINELQKFTELKYGWFTGLINYPLFQITDLLKSRR